MKTDKNVVGATIAFGGMALILVYTLTGGLWRKYAPALREWLIQLSESAALWLESIKGIFC